MESSAKMVPAESILMTSRASVGFFAIMDRDACTNQGFINIVPHDEELRLYILFDLINRVPEIRSNAQGTTYPEISKGRPSGNGLSWFPKERSSPSFRTGLPRSSTKYDV